MQDVIYTFSNGIRVRKNDLIDFQVERYQSPENPNLHEPVEEAQIEKILAEPNTGPFVFLDIGAAIGYYSVLVKKRKPDARIIAVDALPQHADALAHTALLNGLPVESIEIIEKAVWRDSGSVVMADKDFSTHVYDPNKPGRPASQFTVEAISVEDLLLSIDSKIDLAKMDVQGAEEQIIPAYLDSNYNRHVKRWIIGTHGYDLHRSIRKLLEPSYEIVFDDPNPAFQPDGLLIARLRDNA